MGTRCRNLLTVEGFGTLWAGRAILGGFSDCGHGVRGEFQNRKTYPPTPRGLAVLTSPSGTIRKKKCRRDGAGRLSIAGVSLGTSPPAGDLC